MNKKMKPKAYAAVLVMLSAMLLIGVNIFASQLTGRFGLRLDMTSNQLYKLSDQTHEVLDGLEEPVSIRVMSSEADFLPLVAEVLREYAWAGQDKIVLEYIDPYTSPTILDEYLQRGMQVAENCVVVESDSYHRVLALEDMFELDSSANYVRSVKCEQQLTSAILYVAGNRSPQAVFTAGHNENVSQSMENLFTQNSYTTNHVTLSMVDVPEDTDLMVIASPSNDFTPAEIKKLDEFMSRGGRIMAFMGPSSEELTNLKEFFHEWGIDLTDTVAAEPLQHMQNNPLNVVPIYSAHPINQYFSDNQIYLVMPSARVLEQSFITQGHVYTQKILYSTDRAYDAQGSGQKTGPYVLAMTAEKELGNGKARLFVTGSQEMCNDALLENSGYANAIFLTQVMNWCTETDSAVSIPAKDLGSAPIAITGTQVLLLVLLLVVVLPLGILLTGFVVYYRRRRS